ncbi:phosphoglycerate mutase-like protein [Saccharata proteae CBS 121410]|uniref:3-phytase n=1 Tax=Saccharata proteae CBS 121410 TaxID=1314787 RepID=A0A9P4HVC1_9PEZI|nr:phosphoglycerate mutase-like protein [Saccharata proteae CBS 121410]
MTTLTPRQPYSEAEIETLYPKELQLQLVQILLRHGERSPVSPRFRNAGLPAHWPYCNSAKRLSSVIMSTTDWSNWSELKYRRRLETFGTDDGPVIASGPSGEFDAVCQPGELTDKGRETTLALGQRLRHLYVDQLKFMPRLISDSDMIYLRATPIPRALESVQQTFWGFYPPSARTADFPMPTILTRSPADETLYPNDGNCRRFAQLSRAFAQRTADRWNETEDMEYLNKMLSKWMPKNSKRVAVDSHPRLSGIMDTINSTLAHEAPTRLPREFYDARVRSIIDKIGVEEWYSGYTESAEYRALGIGALVGDVVSRMTGSVERNGNDGLVEIGGEDGELGRGRGGEKGIKLALSGCHDTTLAGVLSSLGAFEGEGWPPYTSHIAFELFRKRNPNTTSSTIPGSDKSAGPAQKSQGWLASLFGSSKNLAKGESPAPEGIARKRMEELTPQQTESLQDYYVRVRYNDKVMQVPGCKPEGKHLEDDTSMCTLEAFKSIVDKYTPRSWKQSCASNLDKPAFPAQIEPAGY